MRRRTIEAMRRETLDNAYASGWKPVSEMFTSPAIVESVEEKPDPYACRKCGRQLKRGLYMHQKYCKG